MSPNSAALIEARLPKFHLETDFLDPEDHTALLRDSLDSEALYKPSRVDKYRDGKLVDGVVNTKTRRSGHRKLEPCFADCIKQRIHDRRKVISDAIGVPFPDGHKCEIEAVQNGDRAFFSRHIDTTKGHASQFRVISAVYYYFDTPQRFSGGALALYSLDQTQSVTIEPKNNMMVFFSSIFPHEVMPVCVPSLEFAAGRFSVNCWILKQNQPSV